MERILQLQKQEATYDFDSHQFQCNFRKSKCNTYKQQYGIAAIRYGLRKTNFFFFFFFHFSVLHVLVSCNLLHNLNFIILSKKFSMHFSSFSNVGIFPLLSFTLIPCIFVGFFVVVFLVGWFFGFFPHVSAPFLFPNPFSQLLSQDKAGCL